MNKKPLDYQDIDEFRSQRRTDAIRTRRHRLFIVARIGGIAAVVGIILIAASYIRKSITYPHRITEIRCVDSITGRLVPGDARVVQDGGLDDDPDKQWSIGPDQTGKLQCSRNVWVDIEVSAPGYHVERLKLDKSSPAVVTIRLRPL